MLRDKPLLGLCPIGKFVFSNDDALRYKRAIQNKLNSLGVDYIDLEGILKDGMVKDQSQVDIVVKHFKQSDIDGIFMPHCNFGTEGAVGMIGKKLGVPVLLWGPRDEAPLPNGQRLRDSLCGLFASSKVLHKLGVQFTYIENCGLEESALEKGIDTFLRAVNISNIACKGIRIGLVGQRIDFFWSTIINESELLERYNIEILPLDMVDVIESSKRMASERMVYYQEEVNVIKGKYIFEDFNDDMPIINVLAIRDVLNKLKVDNDLEGIAFQSFMSVVDAVGSYCSLAECLIGDDYPIVAESDIHGAISAIMLRRASHCTEPVFLAEFTVRHPENDNGILLWHEGAPLSMCSPNEIPRFGRHWILPSPLPGMSHFALKDGPITVARFDGDHGDYKLAIGEGRSIDGPRTLNNYVWMEVDDWPSWERTLINGPFVHHVAMAYGNYGDALRESTRYISGLEPIVL